MSGDQVKVTLEFDDAEVALEWLRRARVGGTGDVRLGRRVRTGLVMTARVVTGYDAVVAELEETVDERGRV